MPMLSLYFGLYIYVCDVCLPFQLSLSLSLSLICEARHRGVKTRAWEKEGEEEKKMRRRAEEENKRGK
jgi:hypothetical protein